MTPERTAAGPPAAVPAAPPAPHNGGAAPLSLPPSTSRQGEAPTTRARSSPGRARVVPSAPLAAVRESVAASGLHPQTWVLEFPAGMELLTGNNRLSRYPKARVVKALREQGWAAARGQGLPRIERAGIHLTYLPPPRRRKDRHPLASARVEDADALAPTGKALIDGIASAGVFASDSRKHVHQVSYELLPGTCPRGQVALHITEVTS